MSDYTLYDPETGRIIGHRSGSAAPDEQHWVEGHHDPASHLILGGEVVAIAPVDVSVSPNRIGGLPAGTVVIWGGGPGDRAQVDDGAVEFDLVAGQSLGVTLLPPGRPARYVEVTP